MSQNEKKLARQHKQQFSTIYFILLLYSVYKTKLCQHVLFMVKLSQLKCMLNNKGSEPPAKITEDIAQNYQLKIYAK